MEKALNRIADIISAMSQGIIDNNDIAGFFRGYLFALMKIRKSQQVSV